jgi:hypothetical protein
VSDRSVQVSAFLRAAQLRADELGGTTSARDVLESLILGKFKAEANDGRTMISTSANGHSVQFALPNDLGPGDVIEIAELALQRMDGSDDPDRIPASPKRTVRSLRVSFARTRV